MEEIIKSVVSYSNLFNESSRRMLRHHVWRRGRILLAALQHQELTPQVLKGVLATAAHLVPLERATPLTTAGTVPDRRELLCVRGISSSAIVFRFMQRWEDVEETINRLERRRLLSSRHLCAAFKILRALPRHPSDAFLQKLLSQTRQRVHDFRSSDLAEVFAAVGSLRCNDPDTLEALTQHLLQHSLHENMSRRELVHLICSLRSVEKISTFAACTVLKEALVAEVLRPSRLKKFSERQLYWILFSFDQFRPVPLDAIERVLCELSAPQRQMHLSTQDLVQIATSLPSLHFRESAVVDAWMARVTEPERLKRYPSGELYRLFDTVLSCRPDDRTALIAIAAELRCQDRASQFSPLTISKITDKLISHGYMENDTIHLFWRKGLFPEEDANATKRTSPALAQGKKTRHG